MYGQLSKWQQTHAAHNAGKRGKDKTFEPLLHAPTYYSPPIAPAAALTHRTAPRTVARMWMCEEEQIIIRFLRQCGENGASSREICRKAASKDAWKENERWAYPHLNALKDKKLIDTTPGGYYRLPPAKE